MAADEEGFFEDWPRWSKPVLALAAMILLGGVWIGIPLISALKIGANNAQAAVPLDYEPMMAVLIAMTTITITGIFVFMTFRIDRGTRLKAERVAKDKINELVKEKLDEFERDSTATLQQFSTDSAATLQQFSTDSAAKLQQFSTDSAKKLGDFATDSKGKLTTFDKIAERKFGSFDETSKDKFSELDESAKTTLDKLARKIDESTRPEVLKEEIRRRIPEEAFRAYVEAVLLANANGQIVKEYAKERAAAMDAKAVEALLGLLRETIEHVAQYAEQELEEDSDGPWTRAKAAMAGWSRRRR